MRKNFFIFGDEFADTSDMGDKFFDKRDAKAVLISLCVGLLLLSPLLPKIGEFLSSLLSSYSIVFSHGVASLFRVFIVCPQSVIYLAPSKGLLLTTFVVACLIVVLSRFRVFPKIVNVVFFCAIAYVIISLCALHISYLSATSYYEKYCWTDFQVSAISPDESAKFQQRMAKVETIADINAVLSEMAKYVQEQLRNQDSEESADESTNGNGEVDLTVF